MCKDGMFISSFYLSVSYSLSLPLSLSLFPYILPFCSHLQSVIEGYAEDQQAMSLTGGFLSPSSSSVVAPTTPGKRPTSIRPLTAAYQASASQHQVRSKQDLSI